MNTDRLWIKLIRRTEKVHFMELVQAGKEDIEKIVGLWHSLAEEMAPYSELNELNANSSEEVSREGFRKHLRSADYTTYLIKQDEKIAGYVKLKQGRHPSRNKSEYTKIIDLYIKERFRGQGIGTEVIEKVEQIASDRGSEYIKVSSEWENKGARRFYKKNGFAEKKVEFVQEL